MSTCLSADAIIAIGDALDWDVEEGLRHLERCEECLANLELLRVARESLLARESVDPALLRSISTAVKDAALLDRRREGVRERWSDLAEAFVAGIGALVIVVSSGFRIETFEAAALAFGLGAGLMLAGRALSRSVPALRPGVADA